MLLLRKVGYWADDSELGRRVAGLWRERRTGEREILLPDPVAILAACGPRAADPRVLQYLRSAVKSDPCMGFSWCRFRCGVPDRTMGCCDQSDGTWMWPEGLSHYVEVHGLLLPDEFVATMEANSWRPPPEVRALFGRETKVDPLFWEEWGRLASHPEP